MRFFTPVTLLLPPTTCFCRVAGGGSHGGTPGLTGGWGASRTPPSHLGAAALLPRSGGGKKETWDEFRGFSCLYQPVADPRCWCTHRSPGTRQTPRMGVCGGAAASKPRHPSLGCGAHKGGFWGVCWGPPKTKAGHIALSHRAASTRRSRGALGEIKRGFRDHQPPAHPASIWLPTLFSHNIQRRRELVPGEIKLWVGDTLCRCHGPAAQSHGSARCSPLPAPISQ